MNNDISEKLAPLKVGSANFKRPKNREDGSDFDDFWTKSIAAMQPIFWNFFDGPKNFQNLANSAAIR